jgi:hypothetical protein
MKYLLSLSLAFLASCNITMQNTSSNGRASDLIDDVETATPTTTVTATLPVKAV